MDSNLQERRWERNSHGPTDTAESLALRACLALLIALPAVAGWCRTRSQDPVAVTLREAVQVALARYSDVEKTRAAASQMKGCIREVRAQALQRLAGRRRLRGVLRTKL